MGQLGFSEMLLIFIVALLVFGPKKLPELGKSLGKGIREFKKATDDLKSTWDEQLKEVEKHVDDVKATVHDATKDIERDMKSDFYAPYQPPTPEAPLSPSHEEAKKEQDSRKEVHQA